MGLNISGAVLIDNLNELSCKEISTLIKQGRKDVLISLTNEKLVELIQEGYTEFWDYLYKKTEKGIHKVYHEKINEYYKTNMSEDIYSVLKYGWTKAVLTYDKNKATAEFIAYASFLMNQQYVMFARKIKEDRIGRSIRYELLEGVTTESSINDKEKTSLVQNIIEDKTETYDKYENIIILQDALNALKEEREDLYELVSLHYLQGIPQTQIADMQNHGQSYISRKIKQGVKFLQDYLYLKSKGNLEELKLDMLSAYNG